MKPTVQIVYLLCEFRDGTFHHNIANNILDWQGSHGRLGNT